MLKFETTMKLNCWVGPLIAVIILITLRQMVYDETQKVQQQQSAIPAAIEKKKRILKSFMAGTPFNRDTALLIISAP